ncbi:hypothetical protein ACFLS1_01210 [Verrucomicrobiota bacterium]
MNEERKEEELVPQDEEIQPEAEQIEETEQVEKVEEVTDEDENKEGPVAEEMTTELQAEEKPVEKKPRKPRGSVFPWLMMIVMMAAVVSGFWYTKEYWLSLLNPAPWDAPYIITATEYDGTEVSEEGANFKATYHIDIESKDTWKKIPLIPATVAIIDSDLPSDAYLVLSDGHYTMLTRKNGKIDVSITFSVAVSEVGSGHKVAFARVPSVTCVLEAILPEEGLDIKVTGAQSTDIKPENGTTSVSAALPDGTPIELAWEKAIPELPEGPSQFHSYTKTLISVAEGIVHGETRIDFSILHTPTYVLELNVPENVSVLEVTGADIRDWRLENEKMTVHFEKEVIGLYNMNIKYEMPANVEGGKINVPMITGSGVKSEKGEIGIVALTNIEIKNGEVSNAHLIDVKDLPSDIIGMTSQPVLLAYRYANPEFDVTLDVNKPNDVDVLLAIIDRANVTIMQTLDGKRVTRAVYNVRNHRNQFLRIELPEGAELWSASVAGRVSQPVKDESGRILLPLVRSQGGSRMSAFPVEIVYAEEGEKPDERGRGIAKVTLPSCSEPIMHLMVSLYVPEQGKYDDFEGTMHKVENFSAVRREVPVRVINNVNQMRQVAIRKPVPGGNGRTDIDVQIPLSGKSFLLEKILVIKDQQWFSYSYRNLDK